MAARGERYSSSENLPMMVVWHVKRRVQTVHMVSLDKEQGNPMEVLRKEYLAIGFKSAMMLNWIGRMLSMQRVSLGRVSILQLPPTVFNQMQENLWLLDWMERDSLLTEVFHDPDLIFSVPSFCEHLSCIESAEGYWRVAIYFNTEFDPAAASAWLGFALIASLLSGIATGLGAGDWNMALNLGTAILAVLSTLQGILVLVLRDH